MDPPELNRVEPGVSQDGEVGTVTAPRARRLRPLLAQSPRADEARELDESVNVLQEIKMELQVLRALVESNSKEIERIEKDVHWSILGKAAHIEKVEQKIQADARQLEQRMEGDLRMLESRLEIMDSQISVHSAETKMEVTTQVGIPVRSDSPAKGSLADRTRQIVQEVMEKDLAERHEQMGAAFAGARAATQDLLDKLEARLVEKTAETLNALEERIDRRVTRDLTRLEARTAELGKQFVNKDKLEIEVPAVQLPTPGATPRNNQTSYVLPQAQLAIARLPFAAPGCIRTGSPCRAAARDISPLARGSARASSAGPPRRSINGLSERLAPPADGIRPPLSPAMSALSSSNQAPSTARAGSPLGSSFRTSNGSRPGSLTAPGRAPVVAMLGGSMQLAPGGGAAAQAARIAHYPQLAAAGRAQPAVNRVLNMNPSFGNVSSTPQTKRESTDAASSAKLRTQHNL